MNKKIDNIRPGMDIAVVGMSGRFPGARNIDEYWNNLREGVESIHFFSDEELIEAGVDPALVKDPRYVKGKGILEGIEYFDAEFFNYSPREAKIMDPQTRIFHECIWEAMENAGYNIETYPGLVGLYAGASPNVPWEVMAFMSEAKEGALDNFTVAIRNNKDLMNTQISYNLNLKGPSVALYTACSTSLVAIHEACQGLLSGDCDVALAGGVSIEVPQKSGYIYQEGAIKSADGHCRAFDGKATGTVYGSGSGVVVLKRVEDAIEDGDFIYAIVKGSAVNNDGKRKVGYTAPSIDGQAEVIKSAMQVAEISPEEISYIETHGTGTNIGDSIEIEGLKAAFPNTNKSICGIGSVKPNIGHLDAAAGVASFIKAVLILKNKLIPPHLYYTTPNLKIDFINSPFYVNTEASKLGDSEDYHFIGVSSFGLGGTNCHIILQEALDNDTEAKEGTLNVLTLAAKTETALYEMVKGFKEFLRENRSINLRDIAYTLQVGRKPFKHRHAFVCRDFDDAILNIDKYLDEKVKIPALQSERIETILLLPGIKEAYTGFGYGIYLTENVFRNEVERCLLTLKSVVGFEVSNNDIFFEAWASTGDKSKLRGAAFVIIQYALYTFLSKWGINPSQFISYGVGELTAEVIQGKLSLNDALIKALEERLEGLYTNTIEAKLRELALKQNNLIIGVGCNSNFTEIAEDLEETLGDGYINILGDCSRLEEEQKFIMECVATLWVKGTSIEWTSFYEAEKRTRIPLPTYPFERKYFWIEGDPLKDMLAATSTSSTTIEKKSILKKNNIDEWFYVPSWEVATLKTQPDRGVEKEKCILFASGCETGNKLIQSLEENGHGVIVVYVGNEYCKENGKKYTINPSVENDYVKLLNDINQDDEMPQVIVHSWLLENHHKNTEFLELGFYSLTFLAKAISKKGIFKKLKINVISKDMHNITGEESVYPEKMLSLATCKVLPQEYPNISCHCVDISDSGKIDKDKLIQCLVGEIWDKATGQIVAYRQNNRLIKNYKQIDKGQLKLNTKLETEQAVPLLKEKGVYVITGGLGQIGLIMANYLAKTVNAKLVLLTRSDFSERQEWDKFLFKNQEGTTARRIQKVKDLEKSGAEVYIIKANASNEEEMRDAIVKTKRRFGKINGVIHAAGVIRVKSGQTPMERIGREECEEQFESKVYGTQVLQKVLENTEIDFCMLVSSLAPILGGLGHIAYAAANLYMDAFVEKMGANNPGKWISVNWAEWRNDFKTELKYNLGESLEKLELEADEGVRAFQQILMMDGVHRIIVSTGDLQSRINQWVQFKANDGDVNIDSQEEFYLDSNLKVSSAADIEKIISDIWKKLYDVDSVSKGENFFEMGATSLDFIHLNSKLGRALKRHIPLEALFEYPTIKSLATYLAGDDEVSVDEEVEHHIIVGENNSYDIAIIGMSGRYPGANNIDEYWDNLVKGKESISFFQDDEVINAGTAAEIVNKPNFIKAKGYLQNAECFDGEFFNYSASDAEMLDPQVRVFMECVWEALEDSGYNPEEYIGIIGIFAGATPNLYWEVLGQLSRNDDSAGQFESSLLYDKDSLTTQISYKLNLKGPSNTIFTGCSTSLVAVDYACRSLLTGQCDMAIAGGVTVNLPLKSGYLYQEGMILSADGHVRSFDAKANGIVFSDGVGAVILKPLQAAMRDGDNIYAVIKGVAVNNDGNRKVGYTAPSINGQAEVIRRAHKVARVSAESISYIETHGTATRLGDPIEIKALKKGFNTDKKGFCKIGTVKSNLGHTMCASGVAGLIKTALALKNRQIPASINFDTPNPEIDFENSPFVVNTQLTEWKIDGYPLRAGVSSFGIGGTNAHIVMEEAETVKSSTRKRHWKMVLLSAKTESALDKMSENLADFLTKHPETSLEDIAYTLQVGRKIFRYRRTMVCEEVNDARECLLQKSPKRVKTICVDENKDNIVYMFPGQGSQYVNMGEELYRMEPVFREAIDECEKILSSIVDFNIKDILYTKDIQNEELKQKINQTEITQPVLFVFEYAIAKLLMSWGIKPSAMIGYSFGEYVAAHLAGVLSIEDALKLIVFRGELMQGLSEGAMLSVPITKEELIPLIGDFCHVSDGKMRVSIAIINGPSCIVAGSKEAVNSFERYLKEKRFISVIVPVAAAVHSPEMEPIVGKVENFVAQMKLKRPKIRYISGLTGTWITDEQATDPGYWARHLKEPIHFSDGINELLKDSNSIFVEVGPGRDLSVLMSRFLENQPERIVNLVRPSHSQISDLYFLTMKLAHLWSQGIKIDWTSFYIDEKRKRLSLPKYPFERKRYWIEGNPYDMISSQEENKSMARRTEVKNWFYNPQWVRSDIIGKLNLEEKKLTWLFLSENSGISSALVDNLVNNGHHVISVDAGNAFEIKEQCRFTIQPSEESHYVLLMEEFEKMGLMPDKIVHCYGVTGDEPREESVENFTHIQDTTYYSVLNLAKAIGKKGIDKTIQLDIITDNMQEVTGEETIDASKATVLAAVLVIPQEYDFIKARSIDIVKTKNQAILVTQLLKELITDSKENVVAMRGGHRWIKTYAPLEFTSDSQNNLKLKDEGVYLITGGLGGIGFILAQHLAEKVKARLILTGRTLIPSKEEWESVQSAHEDDDPISEKIKKIKKLQDMGAKVLVISADAADEESMNSAIELGEKEFGPINGVIHTAGILDGKSFNIIRHIKREECELQFKGKVYGLMVLEKLLRNKQLDFCMLMSSVSAILGGLAFVSYSAANIYMDSFVQKLIKDNALPWISVDWSEWKYDKKTNSKVGNSISEFAMSTQEAIEAFEIVLASGVRGQIVNSPGDLEERIKQWVYMENKLAVEVEKEDNQDLYYERPGSLMSDYIKSKNSIEESLVEIWQKIFKIKNIGVQDDFFELGGDSLKAITVVSRVHKELNVEIPVTEFFQNPTIEKLAVYVSKSTKSQYYTIEPVEKRQYYHVSEAQKRIYIIRQLEDDQTSYNTPVAIIIEGKGDAHKLEESFRKIIARHETLRTAFRFVDGELVQYVYDEVNFNLEYIDISHEPEKQGTEELKKMVRQFIRPFDLAKAPLIRGKLVKISEEKQLLMYDLHHIISDGVSANLVVEELIDIYTGIELPELKLQFRDFSEWQNRLFKAEGFKKQQDYWLEKLSGELPILNMPTDFPRPLVRRFEGDNVVFEADAELTKKLNELASETKSTLYIVLLAAYNILLSKYTGQHDILIGLSTAGRPSLDLENIIGMFVNTVVMRNKSNGSKNFIEFLEEVKNTAFEAYENQDNQFDEIVEKLGIQRDPSRTPLFDTMFTLQNLEVGEMNVEGIRVVPFEFETPIAKFDLNLNAWEVDGKIQFIMEYATMLFRRETIENMVTRFINIMKEIVDNWEIQISQIESQSTEKISILLDFNDDLENE